MTGSTSMLRICRRREPASSVRQGHAQGLYEAEGYRPTGNFNDNPVATFVGEKHLTARSTGEQGGGRLI